MNFIEIKIDRSFLIKAIVLLALVIAVKKYGEYKFVQGGQVAIQMMQQMLSGEKQGGMLQGA
jgi:hypothetical protein